MRQNSKSTGAFDASRYDEEDRELSEELGIKDPALHRWASEYKECGEFGSIRKACRAPGMPGSGCYEYLGRRKPARQAGREDPASDGGPIFHSGRGSQYTSRAFGHCLELHGISHPVPRPGNPWGNAVTESSFKTIRRELVKGGRYETRHDAKQAVFKYTGLYYNIRRIHSSLDYQAPCDSERRGA